MTHSDSHHLSITEVDSIPTGIQEIQTLHLKLRFSPPLGPPFSILSLEDGSHLLSDEFNHRLLRFDQQGELIWQLGGKGNTLGKFWYPRGMTLMGEELYVCDSWNHRIQVINLGAHAIRSLGTGESKGVLFDECSDVRVDSKGQLWVADTGNHCLKVVSSEGRLLQTIGRRLSKAEEKVLLLSPESGLDVHSHPGFCYPRRFLSQYPFAFCLEDRGNDRLLLLNDNGFLYGEMDTESEQVVFHHQGFDPLGFHGSHLPVAYLKGHGLKVVNWQGVSYFEAPVTRFSEIQSWLIQEEESQKTFLIHTFDWTAQDIIKYRIALPVTTGVDFQTHQ